MDDTRTWPPFIAGEAAVFLSANKNKRGIALDLKQPEGQVVLRPMVAQSDVVIESYRTRVAARLGIDYETLRELRPDLIDGSISAFGRSGPLADRPGHDMLVQAFSAIMNIPGKKADRRCASRSHRLIRQPAFTPRRALSRRCVGAI